PFFWASGLSATHSRASISPLPKGNLALNSDRSKLHSCVGNRLVPRVVASLPSRCNSFSGTANSVKPQSMQTRSFGNRRTGGLSRFFSPGKWTLISELNFRWFSELHDLHDIASPHARPSLLLADAPRYPSLPPRPLICAMPAERF